jgi:membrane-associated protein
MLDFLIHFDTHLSALVQQYGAGTYLILFAVIFAETGFVVTPFLPGDSLLFVLGAFTAQGTFRLLPLTGLLILAAFLGDNVNYAIGKYLGSRLIRVKHIPFFKKEYLDRAHHFYKKHGGKTIILARFMPILRTFAPFVAGVARMHYVTFLLYSITGGMVWVSLFVFGGFYFGNIPIVKERFSLVTMLIIVISIMPGIIEFYRARSRGKADKKNLQNAP